MSRAMSPAEELALSDRLARGDRQALGVLYELHGAAVFAVALRVLRDRHESGDVVQETFLEAWRTATHYDPRRARMGAWLVTIARSRAVDRLRALQAAQRRALASASVEPIPAPPPDVQLERRVDRLLVRAHLERLPSEQRHVLELAWNDGLSQSEIASRTGIPLGTVKTRTRQGLLRLAAALKGEER